MSKTIFDQVSKEEFEKTLATYEDLVGRKLKPIYSTETISYLDQNFNIAPHEVCVPITLFYIRTKDTGNEYYIINNDYLLELSKIFKEEV